LIKIVSTKKINAGFLAIILIVGTLAAISPSFVTGAQAFLMDNNYESDYGMNSYDGKQSYGKDNNYYKSKDSSNVKCNNINVNGLGINALPPALNGLATDETQAAEEGEVGASSIGSDSGRSSGSDTNFRVVCIYNNIPPEPCAEADDIEACFEEFLLLPDDFELLTDALASPSGLTAEINGQEVTLRSFDDICEALGGITTWNEIFLALLNIAEELSDPTAPVGISGELVDCIAEALGIPLPQPPPEG